MTIRRFYARPENIGQLVILLDESETRHLRDVLRLSAGDRVHAFDGLGVEYACRVERIAKRSAELHVESEVPPTVPESTLELCIAAAITPGEKFDLVVQKAVELGVRRLTPITTVRCEVRAKDALRRVERWRKIAFEASKQCGRAFLMEVGNIGEFKEVFENRDRDDPSASLFLFSERDGQELKADQNLRAITAIYGPKGGWDDAELSYAREAGATTITLGGRILRAETAAIAITAILQHRFGDLR